MMQGGARAGALMRGRAACPCPVQAGASGGGIFRKDEIAEPSQLLSQLRNLRAFFTSMSRFTFER